MAAQLPDFTAPPVVEVALAIQFAAPVFEPLALGTYWTKIRDDFPRRQEQPPLAPMREDFGVSGVGELIRVELMNRPPMLRYWFMSEDESELIQVQDDRFALNWRRMPSGGEYPRYPALKSKFERRLSELLETTESSAIPNWCEVTYINHIGTGDEISDLPHLEDILDVFKKRKSAFPPDAEDTQLVQRFIIPSASDQTKPQGRLTVTLASALRVLDMEPIYVLTLTARGQAEPETVEGALTFLDVGREWVVRGFEGLTTKTMHTAWGYRS